METVPMNGEDYEKHVPNSGQNQALKDEDYSSMYKNFT